jgi:uncharacterized protein (TIGR03086 family)
MSTPVDLGPAAQRLADLVASVPPPSLGHPTPCASFTVGDLLDHIARMSLALRGSALKQPLPPAPGADGANLPPDWPTRLQADLLAMAEAWADPAAWEGMSAVGGIEMPAEACAMVGLDELVLHGWDLAKATGQPSGYDGPGLEQVHETVTQFSELGIEGLFGPQVPVPADAPLLDRILGISGRDPGWQPPAAPPPAPAAA